MYSECNKISIFKKKPTNRHTKIIHHEIIAKKYLTVLGFAKENITVEDIQGA